MARLADLMESEREFFLLLGGQKRIRYLFESGLQKYDFEIGPGENIYI